MRILAVLAASAALMFASAASASPTEEAGDRLAEALLSTEFEGVADSALAEGGTGAPFMVLNPGNVSAVAVGCESRCTGIRVTLRAAGLPPLAARANPESPHRLLMTVPAEYANALSNFELDVDVTCGGGACVRQWAVLTRGARRSAEQRGMPRLLTEREWDGAGETVPLSQITWQSMPTADDLRFFYPIPAWRANQGGDARLNCLIGADGALRCRAAGAGAFSDAALKLATRLRAPTNDNAGQPLANRRVVVPFRFEPQS